jgi:hypothetical protein
MAMPTLHKAFCSFWPISQCPASYWVPPFLDFKTVFNVFLSLLYQLSYIPHNGRDDRTRTCDPRHLKLLYIKV